MADTEIGTKLSASNEQTTAWERNTINRLLSAGIIEQRRARRWGIFFKSLIFLYLFLILMVSSPIDWTSGSIGTGRHTALIDVQGVIADNSTASADNIVSALRAAFQDKNTAGVILRINSPGGSPVQAGYINDEIQRLRVQHPNIRLYAVITDICASGGYYIAAAADKIYADKASLVGSIGVLMDGFGFVGSMEKLGVERRLLTAGQSKGFLDPFSPVKEEDVQHVQGLLNDIHQQFIDTVKRGRGERLKETPELFTGLIWTGEQSVELGLVDALGGSSYVAREVIKVENIKDFTARENYLDRLSGSFGMAMAKLLAVNFGLSAERPTLR
jgi:protease-4